MSDQNLPAGAYRVIASRNDWVVDADGNIIGTVGATGDVTYFAKVETDPNTGEIEISAGEKRGVVLTQGEREAIKRLRESRIGTVLSNWVGATIVANGTPASGSAGVVNTDLAPTPDAAGYGVRLIGDASIRASAVTTFTAQSTGVGFTGIAFWAKVKGRTSPVQMAQVYVGATADPYTGKSIALTAGVPADGKWHLIFIPKGAFQLINSFVLGTDTIQSIGIRDRNTAGIGYPGMLTNAEELQLGPVYINPYSRPKFLIRMDDSRADVYETTHPTSWTADGVTRTWNHLDLMTQYGFGGKGSCFHLARKIGLTIGTQRFLTTAQMASLADLGWSHCTQTYQDPVDASNNGVLLMGPVGYTAKSVSSVDTSADTITASASHNISNGASYWGYPVVFDGTDLPSPLLVGVTYWARYSSAAAFTLHPTENDSVLNTNKINLTTAGTAANFTYRYAGSANDTSAIQADLTNCISVLDSLGYSKTSRIWAPNQGAYDENCRAAAIGAGIEMVLGIGRVGSAYNMPLVRHAHMETTGNSGSYFKVCDSYFTVPNALQTDGAPTAEDAKTYVDAVIAHGGIGSNYHHALTASNGPVLAGYLGHLRLRQSEGVCDVVTAEELRDYIVAARSMTSGVVF